MIPKHNPVDSSTLSRSQLRLGTQRSNWFYRITSRMGIGAKVSLGYAVSLGIAILGIAVGVSLGDYYQEEAIALSLHTQHELDLLYQLHSSLLKTRSHQQKFILVLKQPEQLHKQYVDFLKYQLEIGGLWNAIESSITAEAHGKETYSDLLSNFLQSRNDTLKIYFSQGDKLVNELLLNMEKSQVQSEEVVSAQLNLLRFSNSAIALKFDRITVELDGIVKDAQEENNLAIADLYTASIMRNYIIASSMVLSIILALILAWYVSRAITHPIGVVTRVARQVTNNSDFKLRVPITTEDEVGALAIALNHLIYQVDNLMEGQKAKTAHQLIQSEKMSSLGRMIAGVAHEVNNPINFIYGNLSHMADYMNDLLELLQLYEAETVNPSRAIQNKRTEIDLEFLQEDLPRVLQSMQLGAERVRHIATSLKNFSRIDREEMHSVDLHACLDSTLLILNNRIKTRISVVRNYGEIPLIDGYTGSLYQVFMNLLSNAIEALDERPELRQQRQIVATTERLNEEQVLVKIADNGPGIPVQHQKRIFETFFTTKPRGIGTGLGLSICYEIIVKKHGGTITFESEPGRGTEFMVTLPINRASKDDIDNGVPALSASSTKV
jgi:signal transduction histidine kinase